VHLTVPLALSYPVSFIPKGCRKPTTEYFLSDTFADLRAVDSTDAEVAFRVQTSGDFSQAEGAFEIRSYDDQLWWPLRLFNRQDGTFPLATADTLFTEIESGRENFLRLRPLWLAARRIETAEIREIVSNGYQAALAGAQRKIADYLLLCGGTPYVADGEPVYVGSHIAGIARRSNWKRVPPSPPDLTGMRRRFPLAGRSGAAPRRPGDRGLHDLEPAADDRRRAAAPGRCLHRSGRTAIQARPRSLRAPGPTRAASSRAAVPAAGDHQGAEGRRRRLR
jgi:hypothetical protein